MAEDVKPSQKGPGIGFSVRGPRDFWGGIVLIALAILAIWASRDLPGQRGFAFGPGTAPRLFAGMLAFIGAAVAVGGLFVEGPAIEKYKIRGPLLVIIAILLFAALIRPFGLVVASYVVFIVSIMGSTEMRWIESVIAAAVMTLFCVLLFVYLLNLPFQLWPQSNAPTILWNQLADIVKNTLLMFQKAPPRP
jgi:putative tricarboxylic transport membrane protein